MNKVSETIADRLAQVMANIEAAKSRRTEVTKDLEVKLVAVTKNHPVEAMRQAIDLGATEIGENRIQEAVQKRGTLEREACWHLIGHLQTNKAKQAVANFDLIHSVDSEHLAQALNKEAAKIDKIQDILVQVNLAREDSKSGLYKEDMLEALQKIDSLPNLRILGLMCMAPNYEDVEETRPLFREMYGIYRQVKEMKWRAANIKYLSMGMTHDYQIAIEEGANIVRVGTAIFGPREY